MDLLDVASMLLLAPLLFVGGCNGESQNQKAPALVKAIELTEDPKGEIQAMQGFSGDALRKLVGVEPEGNLCISPFSLVECFSMLRQGTRGTTDEELAKLFDQSNPAEAAKNLATLRSAYADLQTAGTLSIANGMWVQKGFPLVPEFADAVRTQFQAEARLTDFPQPGLDEINKWVSEKTRGRIEKIFEGLDPRTVLVLANAVAFKDSWKDKFNVSNTAPRAFHLESGETADVPTMSRHGEYSHLEGDWGAAVRIPYKSGLHMTVAVPKGRAGELGKLLEDESQSALFKDEGWMPGSGEVSLPKWTSEFDLDLVPYFKSMGVVEVFTKQADLSGMSAVRPLWVDQARQKTFIKVDEEGTEAAAVTSVAVAAEAAPAEPWSFRADRPFLYIIGDPNGVPLFMGIVRDPRK